MRTLCLLLLLAALPLGCGAPDRGPAPPPLPAGYRLYHGGPAGFQVGVTPGWQRAGDPAADSVDFNDPAGAASLLVHVGAARSADLDAATGAVMFELTGGGGVTGGSEVNTTLAGRPARRVRGSFEAAGGVQGIDAVVTLDGGRAWVLALAGPADRLRADQADLAVMRASFLLTPP